MRWWGKTEPVNPLMNVLSGIYPYGTYEGDIIYDGQVCKLTKSATVRKRESSSSTRSWH